MTIGFAPVYFKDSQLKNPYGIQLRGSILATKDQSVINHSANAHIEAGKGYFSISPGAFAGAALFTSALFQNDKMTSSFIMFISALALIDSYSIHLNIGNHFEMSSTIRPVHMTFYRNLSGNFKYFDFNGRLGISMSYFWKSKYSRIYGVSLCSDYQANYSKNANYITFGILLNLPVY